MIRSCYNSYCNSYHNRYSNYSSYSYKLVLYTANYNCNEKFNKITVKEYDFNPEHSNEKIIYTGKWFDQIELDIKLNKIYVYELSYDNSIN